jgi:rRNA maturation protein Nop10
MICHHIYEIVNADICPSCGRDTHEINWNIPAEELRRHYSEGNYIEYICPEDGGTIRGWWSI